jgi:hypothetical protein
MVGTPFDVNFPVLLEEKVTSNSVSWDEFVVPDRAAMTASPLKDVGSNLEIICAL